MQPQYGYRPANNPANNNNQQQQQHPGGNGNGNIHHQLSQQTLRSEDSHQQLLHQQQQQQFPMMPINPPPQQQQHIHTSMPPQHHINMHVPYSPSPMTPTAFPQNNNIMMQPQQQLVSRKTVVRNIELTAQGNLVIDIPVPDRVLALAKYKQGEEFTHMRYTAATCDADAFSSAGYTLRQQEMGRKTEVFIVVTMYNEDEVLFCKTMVALMKNIAYLCQRTRSTTWGEQGWKNIVICIVSDGRTKINPRVLNVLGIMGAYQDGIMKNKVNDKDVTAHIFEYTTQIAVDTEMNVRGHEQGFVPVQILFCLKEKNAKKINSHRWFFNAFGQLLRPNVCILIDVGTKPSHTSIYHLWKAFDRDPHVGGACGEIYAELGNYCSNLLNPLVAAQNFEYKMSNILDKPLESSFGFISVLPGAFSAYRYAALQGRPLQQYFKGEVMHDGNNIFMANMYLAEDRILCFELVTKAKQSWVLRYIKAAKAETDVPDAVPEFISQRRRWLNGSLFAGIYALIHWSYIFRSNHSIVRKFFLFMQFIYNIVNLFFSWFSLSFFYLTFYFLMEGSATFRAPVPGSNPERFVYALGPDNQSQWLRSGLQTAYLLSLVTVFISSLGNRPQGSKILYTMVMILFSLVMGLMLYLMGFSVYAIIITALSKNQDFMTLFRTYPAFKEFVLAVGSIYGVYFLSSFLFLEPWHMFTSFIQYTFLQPSYINILTTYAFCNLHDVSWGTKGDNGNNADLGSVKVSKNKQGKDVIEIEMPNDKRDINANYERHIAALRAPKLAEGKKVDAKTQQEDYFKSFRTKFILSWVISNGLIMSAFSNDFIRSYLYTGIGAVSETNPFLKFIFYSMLGLSAFRFMGCLYYLLNRLFCR